MRFPRWTFPMVVVGVGSRVVEGCRDLGGEDRGRDFGERRKFWIFFSRWGRGRNCGCGR